MLSQIEQNSIEIAKYKTTRMLIFVFIIIIPNDGRTYKQVHLL